MHKKDFLLHQMIKQYVKCQEPIGSESLKVCLQGKISSATIRNYFKILGQEGVVVQTHISSGRVPTSLALRNYWREQLDPKTLMPHIDSASLQALCQRFGITCAIKSCAPQKLLKVQGVEVQGVRAQEVLAKEAGAQTQKDVEAQAPESTQKVLVLVFERDCVAIPFVPSMARFCQELIGVQIRDIQKIAKDVCAKSLSQALKAFDSAGKTQFFGVEFLGELLSQKPQVALDVLNGDMFNTLDYAVFFPESSEHIIIAHDALYQQEAVKMLCVGRLCQDYEGFYEALGEALGRAG
ncbi:hypothetical protein BKN38_02760 [Helicobacter sp. CLO-3]|uniref:hypothetical protein n=1 Tax=unclassified Helicobacter TaxID=2593540 RepID=UPI000805F6C2|nr:MULTISPECIES: hypothetical protein [unclassified Helicobacter]OBV28337.1 hypothetical protein BA723_02325 [Helicobacter sp. CLO-3]OHU84524.1 hypothetical protein BKN38_02760 [Helicobacter sp. CLO-3]